MTEIMTAQPGTATAATSREVRQWARLNGHQVGDRGRIPAEIKKAFTEATGRAVA